jgi:hypothetical protein
MGLGESLGPRSEGTFGHSTLGFLSRCCFKKNDVGHESQFLVRCCGSRERKGFMVKVWWVGQDQQEDELVEYLPGYRMECFRQLSDEI